MKISGFCPYPNFQLGWISNQFKMGWLVTIYKKSGYFKVDMDMVMGLGLKPVNMHTPIGG